jgi:hypothetical protein
MALGAIANLIPTGQALALTGHNIGQATKKGGPTAKDMMGLGVTNIVGVSLIGATAGLTSKL